MDVKRIISLTTVAAVLLICLLPPSLYAYEDADVDRHCMPEVICDSECRDLHSGWTKFRFPSLMRGACLVDLTPAKNAQPSSSTTGVHPVSTSYCQCQYNNVNVPCPIDAGAHCPASPAIPGLNLCDITHREVGCTRACQRKWPRWRNPSNHYIAGVCEDTWVADSLWNSVAPKNKSSCVCFRRGIRL